MHDTFEKRVAAAAVAGWWVVVIVIAFLTLQWIAYLLIMNARPAWLLTLWGPEVTWPFVQTVWFWMVGVFKLCVWLMASVALWLTLWARRLRKQSMP